MPGVQAGETVTLQCRSPARPSLRPGERDRDCTAQPAGGGMSADADKPPITRRVALHAGLIAVCLAIVLPLRCSGAARQLRCARTILHSTALLPGFSTQNYQPCSPVVSAAPISTASWCRWLGAIALPFGRDDGLRLCPLFHRRPVCPLPDARHPDAAAGGAGAAESSPC